MIEAPRRGFTETEYATRCDKAQRLMAADGLDGLLLTTEAEIRYFTGFFTQFWQSPTRPWFVVVPQSGKPTAVVPTIGASVMRTGWVGDVRAWSSPNPDDDGISLLADTIGELFGSSPALGLPMGPETHLRMPLQDFAAFQGRLADLRLVDATSLIRTLRQVKSEAEIEKVRFACQSVGDVFDAFPGWVGPGMSARAIFRQFKIACLQAGIDDVSYLVSGAGRGGYGDIISPPGPQPIGAGDVLMLDTGCVFDGYFCDFDRNFGIGAVDDQVHESYATLWRATEMALDAVRPGIRCCDLFSVMREVINPNGPRPDDVGRYGHGLGMQLTEPPSHARWDQTVLSEGMVLTLEPSMSVGEAS